ncbi:MAG: PaaI family thioesterase [Syntrophales bacterium]|nr:PaaI family thioesterase [Syntrophales bacterium]
MKIEINDPIKFAKETVGGDPFAAYLGIVVEEVSEGYARISLKLKPEYLNALERAHGGIVAMMLDHAFAVSANSRGVPSVSLTMTINYISGPACGSTLVAEARPVDIKRKVSIWDIVLRTREGDTLVATGRGIAYHQG